MPVFPLLITGDVFLHYMFKFILSEVMVLCLCSHSLSFNGLRLMKTMTFAIKEINRRSDLLPHLKLGFHICDSSNDIPEALRALLLLVNGQPQTKTNNGSSFGCAAMKKSLSPVIIGDASSGVTIAMLRTLGPFNIPMVRPLVNVAVYFSFFIIAD